MRACSWILPVRSTRSRNATLPDAAARGDAPGDAVGVLGFLAGGEVLVGGEDVGDRLDFGE